jgi:hypothetical protein
MGQGRPVHLFLRDVSHIDEHGRSLLSRLARKGVRLSASGVYSSYIVAEIGKGQPQPSASARTVEEAGLIPRTAQAFTIGLADRTCARLRWRVHWPPTRTPQSADSRRAAVKLGPATAMPWEAMDRYPTLPNGTSEGWTSQSFFSDRTGKDAPANTGQVARRCAIDSSAPAAVSKKDFCSSDPSSPGSSSEVIEAFSSRTGAYASTAYQRAFVCRHLLRRATKCRSGDSPTPSVQRDTDWALLCDHCVVEGEND